MTFRLSTLSSLEEDGIDYATGDLSLFPELLDDKNSLYTVKNNCETKLKQSLTYNGKYIIVEDASSFPESGIVRLGVKNQANYELVYYNRRNNTTFMDLSRGFAGSVQNTWSAGDVWVTNGVMAEYHNAIKDAIINMEINLGTKDSPTDESLNGLLKSLEYKHLAPKPMFRAYPLRTTPNTSIHFQNFSNSKAIRFFWDFGDGSTSIEKNPDHTYTSEGVYTVKLNMIMSTGAQGVATKTGYITISEKETSPFFYISLQSMTNEAPATYEFVDQTDGDIAVRYWVFGDDTNLQVDNPNVHSASHTYTEPGEYNPSLLIVFKDQTLSRVFLKESIIVE